jgi:hypothetical protein
MALPLPARTLHTVQTEFRNYRRDHLRALAQRVEVDAKEVRIMGSKSVLLRTLVAASSAKTAGFGVPSFVPHCCAPEDSNLSSADLPVSQDAGFTDRWQESDAHIADGEEILRCAAAHRMAEGKGVEPSTARSARFSRPVACHHAPPSNH